VWTRCLFCTICSSANVEGKNVSLKSSAQSCFHRALILPSRHRLVGALLRKRRLPDLHVASDRAAEDIEELQKVGVVFSWAR